MVLTAEPLVDHIQIRIRSSC